MGLWKRVSAGLAGGLIGLGSLVGCGAPILHAAATAATAVEDAGLIGAWESTEPAEVRAVVSRGAEGAPGYRVAIEVRDEGELKTSLMLDLLLTDIAPPRGAAVRYADLFLAGEERDRLAAAYGGLAIPVHQVLKVVREGETLTVWSLRDEWLDGEAKDGGVLRDRVVIGGGEMTLLTAPTDQVRDVLSRRGGDPRAFGDPMVFQRKRR